MSYNVVTISHFERQAKKLFKKYASLISEISKLGIQLKKDPFYGIPIGNNCYKIRIAIASKDKGKRGGARLITHIIYKKENGLSFVHL